jgi:hydrogenase expression/formation protein HypC
MIARELPQADACHPQDGCITCGDTAVAMRVERVDAERALASCSDETGASEDVAIELVEPVEPGDALLVHAGVALARLAPEEVPA